MEKPTLGTDNCQGQSSGRRGVSSPALFPDSDYQPLPIVPLRCSDRLKDKDIAVPCAIPKPKKKNSVNSGSCSGLPGLNDRQNNRSTTTADMSRPTKPSTSLVTGSPLSICNGDLLQAWQQSSLPSQSSVSLSLSAAPSRQRQGGGDIDNYLRPSPALPERQGMPAARGGFSIPLTLLSLVSDSQWWLDQYFSLHASRCLSRGHLFGVTVSTVPPCRLPTPLLFLVWRSRMSAGGCLLQVNTGPRRFRSIQGDRQGPAYPIQGSPAFGQEASVVLRHRTRRAG